MQPLQGKTVIITRAQGQQSESSRLFIAAGAKTLELPSLVVGPPKDWKPLDSALSNLESFSWIIFSSSNGVNYVEARLRNIGKTLSDFSNTLKIAVVGKKTASVLREIGVGVDFIPSNFIADSLVSDFPEYSNGLKILIPRVQSGGRTLLAESFINKGCNVSEVAAYETSCPASIPEKTLVALRNSLVDAIVFTSAKTAKYSSVLLEKHFGEKWLNYMEEVRLISIGPQTTLSCLNYFKRVDLEATKHDLDGLLEVYIQSVLDK